MNAIPMEPAQLRLVVGIVLAGAAVLVQCTAEENPGAASGGNGGQGGSDAPPRPDCLPNVPNECVQEMCRKGKNDCGAPTSLLDEQGCYRAKCSTQAECAPGEECREVTYAPISCGFGPPNDQVCSCGNLLSVVTELRCFPIQFGDGGPSGGSGGGGGGGSGGTGGEPPDAASLLAECLTSKGQSCAFCCGKYFYSEMHAFGATLQPCVCATGGPCVSACSDNGFCTNPSFGPSSTCEPCLLAQRAPNAPCAAGVTACAASATCAPYLDCLSWCGADGG